MKRILALLACGLLLVASICLAHEGHHHDPQMAKLHKMMPAYAKSQQKIAAALQKQDAATIQKEVKSMLASTGDLKKSKPHKGLGNLEQYKEIAATFEKDLKDLSAAAGKGEFQGAQAAFADAQKQCNVCHAGFRD
jgi:cytochrome c556